MVISEEGRAIRASDAAFTLIDAVPAAIADPGTTAVWEQALDMIEAGQMTLDTFIAKQSSWVAQLVQQYRGATLDLKLPPAPNCPQCGARCASAAAVSRCVLVLQPLPGLQGHAAGRRRRGRQARRIIAHPAHRVGAPSELTLTSPSATPAAADGGANLPHPAGFPSARSLLQRCARPAGRDGHREKVIAPSNRARRGSADRGVRVHPRAVS